MWSCYINLYQLLSKIHPRELLHKRNQKVSEARFRIQLQLRLVGPMSLTFQNKYRPNLQYDAQDLPLSILNSNSSIMCVSYTLFIAINMCY